MVRIYKSKMYRIVLNIIYGILAAVGVTFIANSLVGLSEIYSIAIGILILLAYCLLVIWDNMIEICVDDQTITVKKGSKRDSFQIADCGFRARTITSSGDTECYLYIMDESGKEHNIDCELIGVGQFENLMEDLGITGDKAGVTKLSTKKEQSK